MKLIKLEKYNCRNCDLLTNTLDMMEVDYESINVDDKPEEAAKYKIMSVPVLLVVGDNGKVEDSMHGYSTNRVGELEEMLIENGMY